MKCLFFLFTCIPLMMHGQTLELTVGTYTENNQSEGVYRYAFDLRSGRTKPIDTVGTPNPSFLTLTSDKTYLYAVNEMPGGDGKVSAFKRNREQGYKLINQVSSLGVAPCHITLDPAENFLFVSNYGGGSLSVFQIGTDGGIDKPVQQFSFKGKGPDTRRQSSSHVHSSTLSPDGKFLLVQDLGTDNIRVFSFDPENRAAPLTLFNTVDTAPGGGPRHLAFSRSGRMLYLVEEMGSRISVFAFKQGKLSLLEQVSLLAPDYQGDTGAADVHISPDGKFLYASNRGDANTLSIFRITEEGRLDRIQQVSVLGKGPRSFMISPEGQYLLIANQYSNQIKVFKRDKRSGKITDTGEDILVDAPVCLKF